MSSDNTGISGLAARIALGSSMSVFAVVAVLGNILFWFALLYDKRVCNFKKVLDVFLIEILSRRR